MQQSKNSRYQFSDFKKKVYKAALDIPLGQVRSYAWVARKIGKPNAVRAVGSALKKNPFAPLIPCHRVIKKDGKIGGYNGGVKNKARLLNLEQEIKNILAKTK